MIPEVTTEQKIDRLYTWHFGIDGQGGFAKKVESICITVERHDRELAAINERCKQRELMNQKEDSSKPAESDEETKDAVSIHVKRGGVIAIISGIIIGVVKYFWGK